MARYDKYDPKVGGFRAHLAEDWPEEDLNKVVGVGLDANGLVVQGGGQTGVLGVLVLTRVIRAGDEPVDIMTAGEIVEFPTAGEPAAPGTVIYSAAADGTTDATAGGARVGHTVESKVGRGARLVVRMVAGAAGTGV